MGIGGTRMDRGALRLHPASMILADAIVGTADAWTADGLRTVAVYDVDKMVDILTADGMSAEDAEDYLSFNCIGAGPGTPVYMRRWE